MRVPNTISQEGADRNFVQVIRPTNSAQPVEFLLLRGATLKSNSLFTFIGFVYKLSSKWIRYKLMIRQGEHFMRKKRRNFGVEGPRVYCNFV